MAFSKFLDPKNDIAFKKIFGSETHKDILIHFINDILGLSGQNAVQDLEFLPTVLDPDIASKKQSLVDVLCRDKNGVQFIVEMQVAPTKGFEKRAQYYAAKAYTRPLNKGDGEDSKYANLKEVVFIAIADCIIFPNKKAYKSHHSITDLLTNERDLNGMNFTFIELPKFKKDKIEDLKNIVEKWCYFFKHADETSEADLEKLTGKDIVIKQAYEVLNQFNWSEPELNSYEAEIKRIRDNQAVLDYQLEKAEEVGLAKGLAAGEAKGIQLMILKMLEQNFDISVISSMSGLTIEEIHKLKKVNF